MQKWALFLFFMMTVYLSTIEAKITGTLIVTYQTNSEGERLNRIRFWLINAKQERKMYPKKASNRDPSICLTKTVVIEDLPPGKYTVQFLVPNCDSFFKEPPLREVLIEEGKVVKLNQVIQSVESQNFSMNSVSLADIRFLSRPVDIFSLKTSSSKVQWALFSENSRRYKERVINEAEQKD